LTAAIRALYFRAARIGGERGSFYVDKATVEQELRHVSVEEPRIVNTDPVTGQSLEMTVSEMDAPTHEGAKELFAYWSDCCRTGDFVMGQHVPARAITRLMKNLNVMEPVGSGEDFRFRLVGSELNHRIGRDITGMLVSEVYPEVVVKGFLSSLNKVVTTGVPVFQAVRVTGHLGDVRRPEVVMVPMKSPDRTQTWILHCVFYW
jgi:hypothetical protein